MAKGLLQVRLSEGSRGGEMTLHYPGGPDGITGDRRSEREGDVKTEEVEAMWL